MFVEGFKKFVAGHGCSMHRLHIQCTGAVFFSCFVKFKRGMPSVSSMTSPLRVCMLRIYWAVILVLAINSLKMKQMDVFFLFCSSRAVVC